jgi:hypothetical protein
MMDKDNFRDTIIIGIGLWAVASALGFVAWGPIDMIKDIFGSIFGGFIFIR